MAQGFSDKWNFQYCCGCIEGKHVRMQAPPLWQSVLQLQKLLLEDANYKFMYLDMGAYGADSEIGNM